jgi:hypothetical protein
MKPILVLLPPRDESWSWERIYFLLAKLQFRHVISGTKPAA